MPKRNKKREEICEVAAKIFVEKGFERTTIRDIADFGGFNSAALYYYFDDKESILYAILIKIMDSSLAELQEIAKSDLELREKLQAVIRLHTRVYGVDQVKGSLIVNNQKSLSEVHYSELRTKQAQYMKIVAGLFDELKSEKQIADLNSTVLTFSLFGMIQWANFWYDPDGPVKHQELEDIFTKIFTGGVFTE